MTEPARGTQRPNREEKKEEKKPARRRQVLARTQRYLIAPKPRYLLPPAVEPAGERFIEHLEEDHDVKVVRVIRAVERPGSQAPPIVVAEMAPDRAARLASMPDLIVEVDHPLRYGAAALPVADPGITPYDEPVELTLQVEDPDGEPLGGAVVHVIAESSSAPALTDGSGKTTVTVGRHEVESITGVFVRPPKDHWSAWLGQPRLSTSEANPVVCAKIDPATVDNWSRRAMGFDRLPPTYRGHGVRIAIIDSGVAMTHDDLADRVTGGHDIVAGDDKSWQQDSMGFGTLAAGLIAASNDAPGRLTGLAPETELYVYKVFPDGRCSDLFEAIDHCIAAQVDVIELGLGSTQPSWLVGRKIEEARQAGIACIAAAGSTSGPVAFPASLPTVLAVAAVGKLGTFPPDSYHATQFTGEQSPEGFFPARSSPMGPELDLCAPGVGVVSTLPPSNLGAFDGTAVAAPHVAALAALVLAHHPEFRTVFQMRNAARVDRLFDLLRASCQPLPFTDRMRVGWGLPDAVVAVGMGPGGAAMRSPWTFGGMPRMVPVGG